MSLHHLSSSQRNRRILELVNLESQHCSCNEYVQCDMQTSTMCYVNEDDILPSATSDMENESATIMNCQSLCTNDNIERYITHSA